MATNLDQELESAIQAELPAVTTAPRDDAAERAAARPPRSKKGNFILLGALLAMAAGVATLFLVGFKDAAIYEMGADEAMAKVATMEGKRLRIGGELVPGSLVKRDTPCEYRFRIQQNGVEMPVTYAKCVIPDTFRDRPEGGVQVTVEGEFAGNPPVLEATMVMAKCASKYDPATHEMEAPGAPKAAAQGYPEKTDYPASDKKESPAAGARAAEAPAVE